MNIPSELLEAFDDSGKITTLALFDAAIAKGIMHNASGNSHAKGRRLALLLGKWNIKPRALRFPDKIAKGYLKAQFAWVAKTGQNVPDEFA